MKARAKSNCPRITPGFRFNLVQNDFKELDMEYLITAAVHTGSQPQSLDTKAGGADKYENAFICLPGDIKFRPARITPKPVIMGAQVAIVVGPDSEDIYTENYAAVKVQFFWDRKGKHDDDSSLWIRTAQLWSGSSWGAQFIPRKGDEVIVIFLNGDPDRPVIIGSVYNEINKPIYRLPGSKTQSGIKTLSYPGGEGFNELRFDDKAGSEEVFIHAQKDCNITVKSRMGQTIGGDSGTVIGGKCMQKISGDSYCEVGGKSTEIANEIVLSAASKITLVIGSTSIEMTSAGFMVNSPRVDLNNGGGATAPVAEPVSGSLGHTGPGSPPPADAERSSSESSSAAGKPGLRQSGSKINSAPAAPENSQNTPAEDDPEIEDDGWRPGLKNKNTGTLG